MPVYWAIVHGDGEMECPPHVPEKLKKLPWVMDAAWQCNSDHFKMALACDFDVIEKAAKKRIHKELNEKQGPIGRILPDLELTSFSQGGASFRQHFHDYVIIKGHDQIVLTSPGDVEKIDHLVVLGLAPGATPEEIKAAYRKEVLLAHPDKQSGDQARFVAVKSAYENLASASDLLVVPKTMTLVRRIEEKSRTSSSSDFDPILVAELTRTLNMQEATDERAKWQKYREALREEERRATRMMNILFKVKYHHKEEARRRAAEDFVKRFQKSARYWDKTDLEKVWFRVGEEAERHTFVEAYGDDLRRRNEDLDPYVRFEEVVLVDTAFYVYVKVGIDAEDAVDFGISLRLYVEKFENVPQYKAKFEAFDYHTARTLFEVDAWKQLYDNKMITSKQADLDVKKAARLYSELQETEEDARAKRFKPCFV